MEERIDSVGGQAAGVSPEAPLGAGVTIGQPAADGFSENDDSTVSVGDDSTVKVRKERAKETRGRREKGTGGLQREKTGIYTLRCTINGKRIAKSTGTRDLEEAKRFAKKFLAPYVPDDAERTFIKIKHAVASERELAEMQEEGRQQLTMDGMWDAYVASPMRRDLAKTTLDGKEMVFKAFLKWLKATHREVVEVRHLTRDQVEEYLNFLRGDHAATTYNNRLCVLREMFRVLMEKSRAKSNPWEGFKLKADDSHSRREFTVEEIARIIEVASRKGWEWRCLFAIALYTGLRLGDCVKLLWSEVDIVRSVIQKVPEKTKKYRKGRPVTVPIHAVLSDILMQVPVDRRTGFVLPTLGPTAAESRAGMMKIHYRIGNIFRAAGIVTSVHVEGRTHKVPDASFHSFRHTFVSMSANAGVPLHIIQSIVGHESTSMTHHYYHENIQALQKAVEAIPSISGTGEVSEGRVAPPDASRMYNRMAELPGQGQVSMARPVKPMPTALPQPETVTIPPPPPAPEPEVIDIVPVGVQEPEKPASDGIVRESTAKEAPLEGRQAERNAVRREEKLAVVEAANRDAQALGGWGLEGKGQVSHLKELNRSQRDAWVGLCIRRYGVAKHCALMDATTELIGNGGYRFLQGLWDKGLPLKPEEAVEALRTFLSAIGK